MRGADRENTVRIDSSIKVYWERATPMNFAEEKWPYLRKRTFRYDLQDYMYDAFQFWEFAGKDVLEVGCGSGIDAMEFARYGANVIATDVTDNAVSLTKALAEETGLPVKVYQAPAHALPLNDDSVDCVYSYGVLHHIPNVDDALCEMHRVLKPGGVVMAMVYNRDSLLYAYSIVYLHGIKGRLLLDNLCTVEELLARYSERIEGCPYTKAYTKDEAKAVFEKWFRDVTVNVRYNVVDAPRQRKVKLGLGDGWELGWHLVVKGRKG